jgi:predicted DCC family thiol-disulfide oxidoreductase YuxK
VSNRRFTLLYDGDCPFCRREVDWLKRQDRQGMLSLEDIGDPAFDPSKYGLTREEVSSVIHGITPDGRVVRRMEAICEAYRAVGKGWLMAPTGWPGLRAVSDAAYGVFARNRIALGRWFDPSCRRQGACRTPSR